MDGQCACTYHRLCLAHWGELNDAEKQRWAERLGFRLPHNATGERPQLEPVKMWATSTGRRR